MNTEIITQLTEQLADIDASIRMRKGAIVDEPWCVELTPGLYLVKDGERFRGGSITGRLACYSPDRIEAAAQHCRDESEGVFDKARPVLIRDALQIERDSLARILRGLESMMA